MHFSIIQTLIIMGSTNSQTTAANILNAKKTFNDPRYGGMFHISPHTGTAFQQIILQERNLAGLIQLATKRKNMQHPNLLTVTHYLVKEKKRNSIRDLFVCQGQTPCQLYLQYPYLTRTLEDLIEEHSKDNRIIPEKEIIRIFRAVVDVLDFLKRNSTCHGDVKAGCILFDHLGAPKLIDSYFINGGKTAYQIVLENPSSMSLLSPQQLENIKHRKFEDLSTIHMSQMFALGLTMIEAMTFQAAMECYNLNSLEIMNDFYQRKEKQIYSIGYSHRLCELVLACLQEDPKQRPAFTDFLKIIGQL